MARKLRTSDRPRLWGGALPQSRRDLPSLLPGRSAIPSTSRSRQSSAKTKNSARRVFQGEWRASMYLGTQLPETLVLVASDVFSHLQPFLPVRPELRQRSSAVVAWCARPRRELLLGTLLSLARCAPLCSTRQRWNGPLSQHVPSYTHGWLFTNRAWGRRVGS